MGLSTPHCSNSYLSQEFSDSIGKLAYNPHATNAFPFRASIAMTRLSEFDEIPEGASMNRQFALVLAFALAASQPTLAQSSSAPYRVVKTISVGGDEGWDYVAVDSAARSVYVSH